VASNLDHHIDGRFLIVDSDQASAARTAEALGPLIRHNDERHPCDVIESLVDLAMADLSRHSLAICAMELQDGTGIDALAYLRYAEPSLPVILTASSAQRGLASEAIRAGALDCVIRDARYFEQLPFSVEKCIAQHRVLAETRRLQQRFNDSLTDLVDEVTRLNTVVEQLESIAVTDEVTGLRNRRHLNQALDVSWDECGKKDRPIAFMMIDIDRFKDLNDRLGHQPGDALLFLLGRVLRENCRETDIVARYGGDEFCILMPAVDVDESLSIAHRISEAFRDATRGFLSHGLDLSVSIGVSHAQMSRPVSATQLVAHADEAMYAAKRSGLGVMTRDLEQVVRPGFGGSRERRQAG